jgi:putative ABC transport system permease protein
VSFYTSAFILGLCYSLMAMGIFISMKIFKIPDITTDGSFTLGAVVTALMLPADMSFWMALPVVLLAGGLAGAITGIIHTRLKVDALLAGILVMTALYSVNLSLMQRSNIPLINTSTVFRFWDQHQLYGDLAVALAFSVFFAGCIAYMLKTDFGIAMRATGSSPVMSTAMGVNTNTMKIAGLSLANALTALSGFLISQYQGFTDINMGIGIVIAGLGSVLIADTLIQMLHIRSMAVQLVFVILGSVLFQMILAVALSLGANPNLLKLITAMLVLIIVAIPALKKRSD